MSQGLSLPDGLDLSGMDTEDLMMRYLSVGGVGLGSSMEVEAVALGLVQPSRHEYAVVAQALNEHFLDRGEDHPVSYEPVTSDSRR